jgi:transposase
MRYALSDEEWTAIKPMLPNKPRGVPRMNDRCVLDGIFWVLRSGGTVVRPAEHLRSVHSLWR